MQKTNTLSECANAVHSGDYDRFLCTLFAPAVSREAIFALLALNLEIARIPEVTQEDIIAHIRYAWWREALGECAEGKPTKRHAIINVLHDYIFNKTLNINIINDYINARCVDIECKPPASIDALIAYCSNTSGNLSMLMAQAMNVTATSHSEAVRQSGTAWALIGLLRAFRFHALQGRLTLPPDLLSDAGLSLERVIQGEWNNGLAEAVKKIVDMSVQLIQGNQKIYDDNISCLNYFKRQDALTRAYVRRLRARDYNITQPTLEYGKLRKLFILLRG